MSLLTKEELDREICYLMSRNILERLLKEKLITKEEKKELNKILLDKYMPIISLLIEGCEDNECNNH